MFLIIWLCQRRTRSVSGMRPSTLLERACASFSLRSTSRSTLLPTGNFQVGTGMSLPALSFIGFVDEELVHVAGDLVERQRVRGARGDVVVLGLVLLGRVRGGRDDRVDDVVDRDHVEDRVGQAGELGQQPAAVRHDQRVGDLEAVDPAGERMLQRALDDRGAHDRQPVAVLAPQLFGGALGERLGQRVDVGPAERLGAGASDVDELGASPTRARAFSLAVATACGPSFSCLARAASMNTRSWSASRDSISTRVAGGLRGLVLGAPVDLVGQPRLGGDALAQPADVAGGDVHDARVALRGEQVRRTAAWRR